MPKSEVEQWRDDIATEDYICGPNPSLCGPDYDPNWQTQSLLTTSLSLGGSGLTMEITRHDTIRDSHTERFTTSVTLSPPAYRTTSVDTVRAAGADTVYTRETLSFPIILGGVTLKNEKAVPVPEIDDDDD